MFLLQKTAYFYRLFAKGFSYFSFGICSLIFSSVGFPLLFILSGFSKKRFQRLARDIAYFYFRFFVLEMRLLGVLTLQIENLGRLSKNFPGVVIANHPSFLDVVILLSIIPDANCIVKGTLAETPFVRKFVRVLYIPNSIPFDEQLERASRDIRSGNPLIVFPEGTRTIPDEPMHFKKGAARFALHAGCDVLPIYIGGNEKIGLRKHDPFLSSHPTERYHYRLKILNPIPIRKFEAHPHSSAVNYLTEEMRETLENYRDRDPENPLSLKFSENQ